MIKLNLDNLLFSKAFLDLKYKTKSKQAIININEKYNNWKLDFLKVDEIVDIKKINDFVKKNKDNYKNVVVLWIGWSALWTRAFFQAIKWKYYNELSRKKRWYNPRLYILDNIDPIEINNLLDLLELNHTLFIVISKSWWTIETLSQFTFFKNKVKNKWLDIKKHFVVVAWENSNFKKESLSNWFEVFDIPDGIWWRFSIFTPVWLLPLAFAWISIDDIFKWLSEYKNKLLNDDSSNNIALLTSMINYHSYMELWKNILVLFPYATNLFFLWEWYKQLLAESLWKWWLGLTPNTAIWVTDQHSQLQLYYDWPNDKILNFIEIEKSNVDYNIVDNQQFSFKQLLDIEKFATAKSITDYNKINYTLLYETQIAIMAEFFWVNAFDQPWVEIWKNIAREIITQNIWKLEFLEKASNKNITFIGWWNGQSWILKLFTEYLWKVNKTHNIKYKINSIVSMSDDWRTTWKLMRAFENEFWQHLPPPWDLRRILFVLSKSKHKDFFQILFERVFSISKEIKNFTILDLFFQINNEILDENKIVDLKKSLQDFKNKKWELFEVVNSLDNDILNYKLNLEENINWHKFWNILMASLFKYFWDYEKMLDFIKKLLVVEDNVLPITVEKAYIKAILKDGKIIEKQDNISNIVDYDSAIDKIELLNSAIIPKITENIKNAIKNSDYIIIWPWDLYTSIIANFIISWLIEEIEKSDAKIIYILNANNKIWETTNYNILDFIEVISKYLWNKKINFVLWNKKIPKLSKKQEKDFKNNISVKIWNIKLISWEYINSKDLYKYNEKLIEDLIWILK